MVQIIPQMQRESFGSIVGRGLGQGIGRSADFASQLLGNKFQQKAEQDALQPDLETVEKTFGKKFADIFKAAPTGGKTELLKHGIDALTRGHNLDDMLSGMGVRKDFSDDRMQMSNPQDPAYDKKTPSKLNRKAPAVTNNYDFPDFKNPPQGYTPKEWNKEKSGWRKENAPLFEENTKRIKQLKTDEMGIKKLQKLSPSLPEGFGRLIVNPTSGEFYGLAQLAQLPSKEAQEWVKEIARFGNRAKDAFGSRVTNFDLQQYMKQFPGLLNSKEGRESILTMMDINNQLDALYERSINSVYKRYGLANIPQEEAQRIAEDLISDETDRLFNEYIGLDEQNKMSSEQPEEEQELSGHMVKVRGPDNKIYEVDESELDLLDEGFQRI